MGRRVHRAQAARGAAPMGHSVGRWDGQVLTVETSNVTANLIMLPDLGSMGEHSDRLRVVERYTRSPDGATLHLTATLDDPVSFRQPLVLKARAAAESEAVERRTTCL